MKIEPLIDAIKKHPDYHKAGMILCHNGVVRGTSRDGRTVSGLRIKVDAEKLQQILEKQKNKPGIIDILVEIEENKHLSVGDDAMLLIVAGDIRENVIAALSNTLDEIKTRVTNKTEFFANG